VSKKPSVMDRAMLAVGIDSAVAAPSRPEAPKTAPGAFLGFMQKESEVARENETLRKELSAWDGAVPAKPLDPAFVKPSNWANRVEESFTDAAFSELKREIEEAGRNVQPIKVRPLPATDPQQYEIVFGHRRHRACLELGVPVWALIESLDDTAMFVEMERENRSRADLSPYEQGQMYVRGAFLFGSMRKLAEKIHRDVGTVSKASAIASLPESVLAAFPSRNEIQFRWSKPLADLQASSPKQLEERAAEITERRARGERLSAQQVFMALTGVQKVLLRPAREILVRGAHVATLSEAGGKVVVEFRQGALPTSRQDALVKAIESLFD